MYVQCVDGDQVTTQNICIHVLKLRPSKKTHHYFRRFCSIIEAFMSFPVFDKVGLLKGHVSILPVLYKL